MSKGALACSWLDYQVSDPANKINCFLNGRLAVEPITNVR